MLAGLNEPLSTQDIALRDRVHTQVCRSPGNCTPQPVGKPLLVLLSPFSLSPPLKMQLARLKLLGVVQLSVGERMAFISHDRALRTQRREREKVRRGEGGKVRRGEGEKVRREGERGEVYIGDREKSGR